MAGFYERTEKHKKLMSLRLKGRIISKETRKKMSRAKKGKPLSKEHIKNHVKSQMNNGKFKKYAKYNAIHEWIRRRKLKPVFCEICDKDKPMDLANISKKYQRNVDDFKWLCKKMPLSF